MKGVFGLIALVVAAGPAWPDNGDTPFDAAMAHLRKGNAAAAVRGFLELAENGHSAAQVNLAILHVRGVGVPLNTVEANYWAWRARLMGDTRAAELSDALAGKLPPRARNSLADRLAGDFEALALKGQFQAFIALGLVEARLRTPPKPKDTVQWLMLAAAFEVPRALELRNAYLAKISEEDRLKVEVVARASFVDWCARVPVALKPASCPSTPIPPVN